MKKVMIGTIVLGSFLVLSFFVPRMAAARSTEELVGALCSKVVTCTQANPQFRGKVGIKTPAACTNKLSGTPGMLLWVRFGLTGYDRQLTAADVEGMITSEEVLVTRNSLSQCVEEISAMDCGVVEDHVKKGLENVEYIISDKGACSKVYTDIVPKTTTVGQLIESICSTYANCQKGAFTPELAKDICTAELNGPSGKSLWDEFGLKKFKNQFTAAEVEERITAKTVLVNVEALNACQREKIPTTACDNFDRYVAASHWGNIDKAIGREAPCKRTLRAAK